MLVIAMSIIAIQAVPGGDSNEGCYDCGKGGGKDGGGSLIDVDVNVGDLVQTKEKDAFGSFKLAAIKKATEAAEPKTKNVKKPASPKKAPVDKKLAINKKIKSAKALD
ncbi:hypothetical protein HCN44_007034 [Aphidius gifuensis]|uniref:Uncharacterized protein n=1 Tax=Aphidius gifuensis TaxID=684658 RepID=A0A835CU15_APHGI|nr:hypothetical protein HCN44_007034 [Aphidius gifuensis]